MNQASPTRQRLPHRRQSESITFEFNNQFFEVGFGFYPSGQPAEVFARGKKPGSGLDCLLDDIGTVVSLSLQSGITPGQLAKSLGRSGRDGLRSSILGVIIDELAKHEAGGAHVEPR